VLNCRAEQPNVSFVVAAGVSQWLLAFFFRSSLESSSLGLLCGPPVGGVPLLATFVAVILSTLLSASAVFSSPA
jgi:hypothetical protein